MTFEYKGAHPRIPKTKISRRRGKKSKAEEKLEETPVVAELRVAVAKEDVEEEKIREETGDASRTS